MKTARAEIALWEKRHPADFAGRCLEATRWALEQAGLVLPPPRPRPHNTALGSYELMAADPEQYGWVRWTHADHPGERMPLSIVYFRACGVLPDGRVAGHIGIFDPEDEKIYSNSVQSLKFEYWADRLLACFAPKD